MKKTKKTFWCIIATLVIIAIVTLGIIALNLDRIVKSGVEIYGPKITKVTVNVDQIHIGLVTASASIKNLVVGNPDGYQAPQAISVGNISVGINPFTILSHKIVVRSINIQLPEITFEGGLGGNNLSKILDNVNSTSQAGGPVVTNSVGQPKPAKKFEVDDLVISGAKVNGSLKLFGREIAIKNLSLPDIHLTNLGTGPDGITASDLTSQVLHALTAAALQAVTSEAGHLGGSVKGAGGLKNTFDSLFGK